MKKHYVYPEGSEIDWPAEWIGLIPEDAEQKPNQWLAFRHSFELDKMPKTAPCQIAVDSKYWLWLNGELVIFEGGLKRGPSPEATYFDSIDIRPWLRSGTNTIAILVWYFGKNGFCHVDSGRAGLVFQAKLGRKRIRSSKKWKGIIHRAYGETGEPYPNRRLPESNIAFDARNDIPDWHLPGFDDAEWPSCQAYGKPPVGPWHRLIKRPIPQWRDSGLCDYLDLQKEDDAIIAKLPYNAQVTPYLAVDAPAGQVIKIQTDNYMGGSEANVRAEYTTRDGVQTFESLGWMNGHAVHYSIPEGVKVLSLKYRETGYNCEFSGTFACDDPFCNRLHEKAVRTLYITMRDTYMDCPDRERSQWWGDVVNELGEAFYALDPRSHDLAKKGMYELINWQRDDDSLYAPVPSQGSCGELPMQMLASVGRFGFWTWYFNTGNRQVIEHLYPGVKRYLDLWQLGPNGLVTERKGDWTWGDWGTNKDMTALYNLWTIVALQGQALMATLIGKDDDAGAAREKATALTTKVNDLLWNGEAYHSPGYDGETDDRANALAVVSGVAKADKYDAIRKVLATEYHASPYMEKYVLEALYLMRFPDDALRRIHKRFAKMVDNNDYTTLWEGWGIGSEGFGGGTINHAWSGGPLTILNQYAAGIAPIEPAYKTYQIMPQMGRLRRISTVVPSVAGDITVNLERDENRFLIELDSPQHTTARIGIPNEIVGALKNVSINGKRFEWPNGVLPKGIEKNADTARYHCFTASPGQWVMAFTK